MQTNEDAMRKIDEIDLNIIRHLWDGRTPFRKIAKELNITTNTVRRRVNKLIEDGILQIIGLVDPDAVPGHYSAVIGFRVERKFLKKALEQIGKIKGVVTATCVTGRFDIIANVLFNQDSTHKNFIYNELEKVEGIILIETFFVVEAVNWQLRYVL